MKFCSASDYEFNSYNAVKKKKNQAEHRMSFAGKAVIHG